MTIGSTAMHARRNRALSSAIGSISLSCLLLLRATVATAGDPSSEPQWWLSFHGGGGAHDVNTILAYDQNGKEIDPVLAVPASPALRELRGFAFGPDGNLYVVNAFKSESLILRFSGQAGEDGTHAFLDVFVAADSKSNPGLDHPFDLAFDGNGDLYVSSQDTILVTRYYGPGSTVGIPGQPMPVASALPPAKSGAAYPPGTFVASVNYAAAAPGVLTSVRGIAFGADGSLFVADEEANQVFQYAPATGQLVKSLFSGAQLHADPRAVRKLAHKKTKGGPIHLLVTPDQTALLVGTSAQNAVLSYALPAGPLTTFVKSGSGGLDGPSGMAFQPGGDFYVASRKNERVLRYHPKTGAAHKTPFLRGLPDEPEFVRIVSP